MCCLALPDTARYRDFEGDSGVHPNADGLTSRLIDFPVSNLASTHRCVNGHKKGDRDPWDAPRSRQR